MSGERDTLAELLWNYDRDHSHWKDEWSQDWQAALAKMTLLGGGHAGHHWYDIADTILAAGWSRPEATPAPDVEGLAKLVAEMKGGDHAAHENLMASAIEDLVHQRDEARADAQAQNLWGCQQQDAAIAAEAEVEQLAAKVARVEADSERAAIESEALRSAARDWQAHIIPGPGATIWLRRRAVRIEREASE